jgi:hypothetical protein
MTLRSNIFVYSTWSKNTSDFEDQILFFVLKSNKFHFIWANTEVLFFLIKIRRKLILFKKKHRRLNTFEHFHGYFFLKKIFLLNMIVTKLLFSSSLHRTETDFNPEGIKIELFFILSRIWIINMNYFWYLQKSNISNNTIFYIYNNWVLKIAF